MARFAFNLLLDSSDPNLEELIQVRAKNAKELDALYEWLRRILCFFEHATIELKPAQLAVDKIFRIGKTIFGGNLLPKDLDVRGRLVGNSGFRSSCRHLFAVDFAAGKFSARIQTITAWKVRQ